MADFYYPLRGKRVFVAGETGLVGRTLCEELQKYDCELLSAPRSALDLRDAGATYQWFCKNKPDVVFVAAAKVGGIGANTSWPAEFLHDNIAIANSVIDGAYRANVPRLLFLGSSCIYPKYAPQPIVEEALMSGPLEPTNEAYAIAKIAGMKMVQAYRKQYGCQYIAAMPTNLYGPYDRFDENAGHVIPAMIEKFMAAKEARASEVIVWGTGAPLREFLYAHDLAQALIVLIERYDDDIALNIGSGAELSIYNLATMIAEVVGYKGKIIFDVSKPDGTPRKFLNSGRMGALGWHAQTSLKEGLTITCEYYAKVRATNLPVGRICASSGR
jgi:GDP-L-fucose synthase